MGVVDRGGRGNVLTRYYTYYAAYTWRFFGVLEFGRECKTQPGARLRVLFNPSLSQTLTVTNKLTMHIAGFFDIV